MKTSQQIAREAEKLAREGVSPEAQGLLMTLWKTHDGNAGVLLAAFKLGVAEGKVQAAARMERALMGRREAGGKR